MAQIDDLQQVIASSPVFAAVPKEMVAEIAGLLEVQSHAAGAIILKQGEQSAGVYFLLAGRLAVRVHCGKDRETVAWLKPPEVFGELSFVTGRACVADIEVVDDARVAMLSKDALDKDAPYHDAVLSGLTRLIAERLQGAVSFGSTAAPAAVVLLEPDRLWDAPRAFPPELAKCLQRETRRPTLLVEIGTVDSDEDLHPLGDAGSAIRLAAGERLRSRLADRLREWSERFPNVILSPGVSESAGIVDSVGEFANWRGTLLGPGSNPPEVSGERFVLQSAGGPKLPRLDGRHQLIHDTAESEAAWAAGRPVSARFQRTADSIARLIAGMQVGLALGGGAAWGWSHVGVLEAVEARGVPVDMIAGCSMGSVIGALRACGSTAAEMRKIADYWRTRTRRFIEWRVWNLCLFNERMIKKVLRRYFDERHVNATEIPFWANAVDIQAGKECALRDGRLVDCVRSSIALPGLLPPVPRKGHLLVDASVMDQVPVSLVREMGAHFVIAVNAMQPPDSRKITARYPANLFDVWTRCMLVMGHEIGQAAAEKGADIVFTPDFGDISMLQFGRSPEIIEAGRQAADKRISAIIALYESRKA